MLSCLQTAFPRYEHTHDIGEMVLARDCSLRALRPPYSMDIEGGCRL